MERPGSECSSSKAAVGCLRHYKLLDMAIIDKEFKMLCERTRDGKARSEVAELTGSETDQKMTVSSEIPVGSLGS